MKKDTRTNYDRVPPRQHPAISRWSDAFQLGPHRVACGSPPHLLRLLDGRMAKACITDPLTSLRTSGCGNSDHNDRGEGPGVLPDRDFVEMLCTSLDVARSASAPAGLAFVFTDWRHLFDPTAVGKKLDTPFVDMAVWTNSNRELGGLYRTAHELCGVFQTRAGPNGAKVQLARDRRGRTNVWGHPMVPAGDAVLDNYLTHKPVAMLSDILSDCTGPGDLVIDPYLSVGSTLIAAQTTGRICIGIDEDPHSVDTAIRRWQDVTGQRATHAVTDERFDDLAQHILTYQGGHRDA